MLWAHNIGILRNPSIWGPTASVFDPLRWANLTPAQRDSNVAFSKGPRNCIGQELALLELKMVLAMTVARFDFADAFDELEGEVLRSDGSGYKAETGGVQEQWGEKAYQIQLGTAKPREGMPVWVKLVVT